MGLVTELEAKIKSLKEASNNAASKEELASALAAVETEKKNRASTAVDLSAAQQEVVTLRASVANLETAKKDALSQLETGKKKATLALEESKKSGEKATKDLEGKIAAANASLEQQKKDAAKAQDDALASLKKENAKALADLEGQLAALKMNTGNSANEKDELNRRIEDLQVTATEESEAKEKAYEKIKALEEKLNKREETGKTMNRLTKDLDFQTKKGDRLVKEVNELKAAKKKVEEEAEEQRKTILPQLENVGELKRNHDKMEADLRKTRIDMIDHRTKMESAEKELLKEQQRFIEERARLE